MIKWKYRYFTKHNRVATLSELDPNPISLKSMGQFKHYHHQTDEIQTKLYRPMMCTNATYEKLMQ